jgi:hypothetical protein
LSNHAQDDGIEAVRSGASRDNHDEHEGIKRLGQIQPIVDPVRFIDRLVGLDPLPPRGHHGDEYDDKQAKGGKRREESNSDGAAGGELYRWHPPLVKAHGRNAQRFEFVDQRAMARCVEQLVVARQHEEHPNRDTVEGERQVGPTDTI